MARRPKSSAKAPVRGPRHLLFLAALWTAALLAYSNSFAAGLVFDSQRVILTDPRIQADTPENVHLIWTQDYYFGTGSSALYRPLTTLTYLWNYAILGNGPNPVAYHWVNFLLHAANIALVYGLGFLIFADPWAAFGMAAVWALHPALTESVTNVVGRADLLAALGILAGLWCYARTGQSAGWRRGAWIVGLAASATLAAFSKESGVVVVAVLVLWEVAFQPVKAWGPRIATCLAAMIPAAVFLAMRASALAQAPSQLISFGDNPLLGADFWTARLTALKVLAEYVVLLLFPLRLSVDYSYNQVALAGIGGVVGLLLCLALAAAAVVAYRRARPVFFWIGFFFVTIAPVSNVFLLVGSVKAERFLYLPAVAFAGCVVWAARALGKPQTLRVALAIVCVLYAGRTWARNGDWHDERALWSSAVAVVPDSYKVHENLAQVLLAQQPPDYAGATREVEKALTILDPLPANRSLPSVYATAGICYLDRGDAARALTVLQKGRTIDRAWGDGYAAVNRRDGKTFPPVGTPSLYVNLGRAYLTLGQPDKAVEALLYGRAIDPQPAFFDQLGRAYSALHQPDQAEISLLEGLAIDSRQSAMVDQLTQLYRENSPGSCALTGNTVNLGCPAVKTQLCQASRNVAALFVQLRDSASAGAVAQNAVGKYGCPAELFR